jgi:cytochrome c556
LKGRDAALSLLVMSFTIACGRPVPPAPLFESRVAFDPLIAKLRSSGGDPGRILRPASSAELVARLESGSRYKFVIRPDGRFAVAPLPADAPSNEYVHPVLADGAPVLTAGGLRVEHDGQRVNKVVVDQDSKAYCPTAASLGVALAELARLGVPADRLRVENRPPDCAGTAQARAPAAVGARYGALMVEVGRRFELLGKAARSGRFDLAQFELEEIQELFEEDLPGAEPPRESAGVDLAGIAQAFQQTHLPELKAALAAKDLARLRAVFGRTAQTCNGCHKASGHPFVEIPLEPGDAVPRVDPPPEPATRRQGRSRP